MHRGYTTPLVIAIMAFAIVSFLFLIDTAIMPANSNQGTNRAANKSTNGSTDTSPTVNIPTDDWKTFSDTSTGVSIHYPQNWQEKSCGDAMIVYFAPEEINCGAGLNAVGLQRTTSDQTVLAAIANRQTQIEQTTVLQLTIAGRDAQRLIGFDPQSALGGSETQQNDEIFFRQDEFLWSLSSTLEDDGRIFLAMAATLALSQPAATDTTADWKTYTNPSYNYTLNYPGTWTLSENLGPKIIQFIPPDASTKTSIERSPALFVTADVSQIDSQEYPQQRTVTINGHEATRAVGGMLYEEDITFFSQMNGYLSVSWPTAFSSNYPEYEQILNSFTQ